MLINTAITVMTTSSSIKVNADDAGWFWRIGWHEKYRPSRLDESENVNALEFA